MTIDPQSIRIGYFGISVLQSLDVHTQAALLHDIVHGIDLPVRLSPGNVDELAAHGAARMAALADEGIDPDLSTLESWWHIVGAGVQAKRDAARHELAQQDGRNPPVPSRS